VLQKAQALGSQAGNLTGDLNTLSLALGDLDTSLNDLSKKIRTVLGGVPASRAAP
jgi:hypothetical protein